MSCRPATRASSNSRTGPSRSPSGQRCAKPESLWRAASRSSCTRCCETGQSSHRPKLGNPRDRRPNRAPKRSDARGREQTTARFCSTRSTYDRLRKQRRPSRDGLCPPRKRGAGANIIDSIQMQLALVAQPHQAHAVVTRKLPISRRDRSQIDRLVPRRGIRLPSSLRTDRYS
jgi:hypothetical protein